MKKLISILLSLTLLLSLGVCAFAEEEAPEEIDLTVLVTGAIGDAVRTPEDEGVLSYGDIAALKASFEERPLLLLDAGGFADGAESLMTAVGYDLAVWDKSVEDGFASIAMNTEGISTGAMYIKGGIRLAVLALAEAEEPAEGEEETFDVAAALQDAVNTALDSGAEYILALGSCADPAELVASVTGINAIIALEDGEDAADTAEPEILSDMDDADVLLVTLVPGFTAAAELTFTAETVTPVLLDETALSDRGLTADEEIAELQAAWIEENPLPEEIPEDSASEEPENAAEPEEISGDDPDITEPAEEEIPAEEELPAEEEAPVEEELPAEEEVPVEEEVPEEEELPVEEETPDEEADVAPTPSVNLDNESDASSTDIAENAASAADAVTDDAEPETPEDDTIEQSWEKSVNDPAFDFTGKTITGVSVGGRDLVNGNDYTVSGDGSTLTILATMLNGWDNNTYRFTVTFSDASTRDIKLTLTGTAPTATPEPTTEPTATAEPTATPSPSPAPMGSNPATGDDSPIGLYIVILVVLMIAIVVVIIITAKKNKRQ